MESIVKNYDSINLELEKDSTFVSQCDNYFYFRSNSKIYEVNEFGVLNTYNLPEHCNCVRKKDKDIYFSSRNVLYKLLSDNKYGQKKLRERILGFLPLDSEYPLLALICKVSKTFQLQINNNVVVLEKYTDRCDSRVLYLDLLDENVVLCVYKTENVIKYCTIGVYETRLVLLRKEILSNDTNINFDSSLYMNCFLISSELGYSVFKFNELNYSIEPATANSGFFKSDASNNNELYDVVPGLNNLIHPTLKREDLEPSTSHDELKLIKLINNHVMCFVRLIKDRIIIDFYDIYSKNKFKTIQVSTHLSSQLHTNPETTVNTNSPTNSQNDVGTKNLVSIHYSKGVFNILIELKDSIYSILSFSEQMPTETISSYDPYQQMPTDKELERLIESSEIVITRKLVDYLISNKIENCCKKILKCVHIPEGDAVRILKNDLSLLDDFILYTRCSENELKKAFKAEMDSITFKKIIYKLFEMMEKCYNRVSNETKSNDINEDMSEIDEMDLDSSKEAQMKEIGIEKIIKMINILLDAKVVQIEEFDETILRGLQNMVEGCQKEQMDLQSLLSFTSTLLDNKIKNNTNQLITSIEISLD